MRAGARLATIVVALTTFALAGCATEVQAASTPTAVPTTRAPTPTPTPLTPSEELLATTGDPTVCAVSFVADRVMLEPILQHRDVLFSGLPIPRADGQVFAGWYPTPAAAASASPADRVNGSKLVSCTARQKTLYGAWTTAPAEARIPILMYHQFTEKPEGESGWLRGNVAYIEDYRAHMQYIKDGDFYLPTWDELSAFIDGALSLPERSVIVTDDDADASWLALAAPINAQLQVMATSFDITGDGVATQNRFILPRSHTNDMHRSGADGRGRMVNLSPEEIAADMETSAAAVGGVKEVMAYPFGHHDERSKEGVRRAGFEMARTIQHGYVRVGTDKLALPTIRIDYGTDVADLASFIG